MTLDDLLAQLTAARNAVGGDIKVVIYDDGSDLEFSPLSVEMESGDAMIVVEQV